MRTALARARKGLTVDSIFSEYLEEVTSGRMELNEAASEFADSRAEVIYPAQAHAMLADCGMDEIGRAQDAANDTGAATTEYGKLATVLAYWVWYHRFLDAAAPKARMDETAHYRVER
jgi:hypothetical protein